MKRKKTTKLVCQNRGKHFQGVSIPFRQKKKTQSNHSEEVISVTELCTIQSYSAPSVPPSSPSLLKVLHLVVDLERCKTFCCLDGDVQRRSTMAACQEDSTRRYSTAEGFCLFVCFHENTKRPELLLRT